MRWCGSLAARRVPRLHTAGLADMYGFIPVDREPGLWGGYAECQYLAPDQRDADRLALASVIRSPR
jgi:alcohol dehydrogenase